MTRRYSHGYYSFWRNYREYIREKLVDPYTANPYFDAARIYYGSAPILRIHTRAVNDLVTFYEVLRTLQELVIAASEALKVYITDIMGYYSLRNELIKISKRVAVRFNNIIENDEILGVIIGMHGNEYNSSQLDRRLKPLNWPYRVLHAFD